MRMTALRLRRSNATNTSNQCKHIAYLRQAYLLMFLTIVIGMHSRTALSLLR